LIIEPISVQHERRFFDCGDPDVTRFLREQALQDHNKNLSRTMVLLDNEVSLTCMIGYHTLLFTHVSQSEIPQDKPKITRGIPVVLLGQLGVDAQYKRKDYGEILLMDVQARVHEISLKIGVRAMILDARNERLVKWYDSYDFIRHPGSLRMSKKIEAIWKLNLI
jgi:hypothetical protein